MRITEADVSVHSSHHIPPKTLHRVLGGSFFTAAASESLSKLAVARRAERLAAKLRSGIEFDSIQSFVLLNTALILTVFIFMLLTQLEYLRTVPATFPRRRQYKRGDLLFLTEDKMTSAEAAITWVDRGIHPDEFAIQT
jgi:hypothetical protein